MLRAFVAEVRRGDAVEFIRNMHGATAAMPKLHKFPSNLKKGLLAAKRDGHMAEDIRVLELRLDAGGIYAALNNCRLWTCDQFMAVDHARRRLDNPDAVFKLLIPGTAHGPNGTAPRFVGQDGRCKHGRTWERGGHLRSHITKNWRALESNYRGAIVLEIVMSEDGVTPASIDHTPILDFYLRSPDSRKTFARRKLGRR